MLFRILFAMSSLILLLSQFAGGFVNFTRVTEGPHVSGSEGALGTGWIDYDNDGLIDLFVAAHYLSANRVYHNNGDGTYSEMSGPGDWGYDAAWGDYDNDGDFDVYYTKFLNQQNLFFENDGDGSFTEITDIDIVSDYANSTSPSWADYDNDGDLDLYVANHEQGNFLFRNDLTGFTRVSESPIVDDAASSNHASWCDYDNDGDVDLFVANAWYNRYDRLYRNDGNGIFTNVNGTVIPNQNRDSWGGSWGDYDNDGDMDLFITQYVDGNPSISLNSLFRNNYPSLGFTLANVPPFSADADYSYGSAWGDCDNDGDLDLIVGNDGPKFIYENNGDGSFTKITIGSIATDDNKAHGTVFGDYDRDGDLDFYVANVRNNNENGALYRNDGNGNNWINIHCRGYISNRSAIGSKVRLKATIGGSIVWQVREIMSTTGFCSHNDLSAHFGLGDATIIDTIWVVWPSGLVDTLANVLPGQFLNITEGDYLDLDEDGILGLNDNCVGAPNPLQEDADEDGVGDACDNCVNILNEDQANNDGDDFGNACDNCPDISSPDHADPDGDNLGNPCDNCPNNYNPGQEDQDADQIGDVCEFICADANGDLTVNILDIIFLIDYKYKSGLAPDPLISGDVNSDGAVNILDIVYMINYKYKSGPEPNCPEV